MPFKSKAQMRFMYAKHPEIAKRWADKYGMPKNMPMHIAKKKGKKVVKKKTNKKLAKYLKKTALA